ARLSCSPPLLADQFTPLWGLNASGWRLARIAGWVLLTDLAYTCGSRRGEGYARRMNSRESGRVTTKTTTEAVRFAQENKGRFVEELKALLRIPSISTDPERVGDVRRAAEFVAAELKRIGMENVRLIETSTAEEVITDAAGQSRMVKARVGHPLVYADWLKVSGAPTVLCYGHYD